MKLPIRFFCFVIIFVFLAACSGGSSDTSAPQATSGAVVKPNLAQVQSAPVNVLTNRYNNSRTGENLNETVLNLSNVNVSQFGKLFIRTVEGHIYAQPLYVQGIDMPDKKKHNVVYVATMHNMVYAFDADDPAQSEPLWKVSLGTPFTQNVFYDIPGGEVGVLSTPVIDLNTQTIYLVSRNWEDAALYKLHALDIQTGEAKFGSPTAIKLSMPGTGYSDADGIIELDSSNQLQRPGLLLVNGHIFIAFGSNNDQGNWFGWLPAYRADNLKLDGIFNVTPDGYQGSIWQGGSGIAADDQYLYFTTANGVFSADKGGENYANSIMKLQYLDGKFKVVDYYTPSNWADLQEGDIDMGSVGTILIPNTNIVVGGGKDGNLYLVDKNHFGGFNAQKNQNLQIIPAGSGQMFVTPVVWETAPGGKPKVYAWNIQDSIKVFDVSSQQSGLVQQASSESRIKAVGRPVGSLAISSNGAVVGSGILWATFAPNADKETEFSGALVAFDANDLKHLLWYSDQNKERDALGLLAKFATPTIANGKVYVPTFSNQLIVYGLLAN